jgi:hypothetical protein
MSDDFRGYFSKREKKIDFYELGISNMEELLSIVSFNKSEKQIRSYFGVEDDEKWENFLGFAKTQMGEETFKLIHSHIPKKYSLGLVLNRSPGVLGKDLEARPFASVEYDSQSIETEVNLIPRFPPIRNQGRRGTCVAHAATAMREFMMNDTSVNFSEQFLYFCCKNNDGIPEQSGTYIDVAFDCLVNYGICKEDTWPYNSEQKSNEGQGPAPSGAYPEAERYKIAGYEEYNNEDIDAICAILSAGIPMVFGVPVFPSWGNYATQTQGKVFMPLPNETPEGGHAMILVGYNRAANSPGGGYFIFRNSWGEVWANNSPYTPGYGTIPFAYVNKYGMGLTTASMATTSKKEHSERQEPEKCPDELVEDERSTIEKFQDTHKDSASEAIRRMGEASEEASISVKGEKKKQKRR